MVFKETIRKSSKSMDDIVSILNKDGEGVLYFGIKPDGEVCGQEISKRKEQKISVIKVLYNNKQKPHITV
ncbi:MAG: putative DNA binding domain-containing protein [bacterium]|nr:putative DNA binding domain-containing protein [bacterium]